MVVDWLAGDLAARLPSPPPWLYIVLQEASSFTPRPPAEPKSGRPPLRRMLQTVERIFTPRGSEQRALSAPAEPRALSAPVETPRNALAQGKVSWWHWRGERRSQPGQGELKLICYMYGSPREDGIVQEAAVARMARQDSVEVGPLHYQSSCRDSLFNLL